MRQTSLQAYQELKDSGKLGERQLLVYEAIKRLKCATDTEITKFMGFSDPNRIRPRRNELVRFGLVEEKERRNCNITNRKAIVWGIK